MSVNRRLVWLIQRGWSGLVKICRGKRKRRRLVTLKLTQSLTDLALPTTPTTQHTLSSPFSLTHVAEAVHIHAHRKQRIHPTLQTGFDLFALVGGHPQRQVHRGIPICMCVYVDDYTYARVCMCIVCTCVKVCERTSASECVKGRQEISKVHKIMLQGMLLACRALRGRRRKGPDTCHSTVDHCSPDRDGFGEGVL